VPGVGIGMANKAKAIDWFVFSYRDAWVVRALASGYMIFYGRLMTADEMEKSSLRQYSDYGIEWKRH
jgi:hypothetical protein